MAKQDLICYADSRVKKRNPWTESSRVLTEREIEREREREREIECECAEQFSVELEFDCWYC